MEKQEILELDMHEIVLAVITYGREHGVDVVTAYERVTDFLTEKRQPYSFREIKEYIFANPEIQA
jgi:hypothetical protein